MSRRDSNPQSQQASGRRPTPYTAQPLCPAVLHLELVISWEVKCQYMTICQYKYF